MTQQTILVVDDDRQIVRLVRQYLEQAGYAVLTAYNGEQALAQLYSQRPALLLLDLGLPDRDGWELTRVIRADERVAKIPIIMLTARIDETDRIIGLELGADDYVPKPFNAREVVARVRALLRRRQWDRGSDVVDGVLKIGRISLDSARRNVTLDDEPLELTPTEFKLLQTLMQSPGTTFHREELLEKALGYGYEGLGRTLDSHIKNLRQKIEPDPRNPSYIVTVYRVGYRFAENG